MAAQIDETTLAQFTGSERYFQHWTNAFIYSDGMEYLNTNGAGWLLDAIASYQLQKVVQNEPFQLWELKVNKGKRKAVLTCKSDSDQPAIVEQLIEYTDFPFSIKIYVELGSIDGVNEEFIAMLSSER